MNKSAHDNIRQGLLLILRTAVIAVLIHQIISPSIVRGHSMENTLFEKDYILLGRQPYQLLSEYKRGDIIVLRSDLDYNGHKKNLVKRIIALPGDTVSIKGGLVYLNGEVLHEPYTKDGFTASDMDELTVSERSLFCLGDNRQNSADSRSPSIGFISNDQVIGKALFRLFPLNRVGPL